MCITDAEGIQNSSFKCPHLEACGKLKDGPGLVRIALATWALDF